MENFSYLSEGHLFDKIGDRFLVSGFNSGGREYNSSDM